jgi:hypothetical protein
VDMEHQEQSSFSTESLARIIRAQFPEIIQMDDTDYNYRVDISEEVENSSHFVKALDDYLKDFLSLHGDPDQEYQFTIQRGRELINILMYNDPDFEIHINLTIDGEDKVLRVVDIMGDGDWEIFDSDFNNLASLFNEYGVKWFGPDVIWEITNDKLKPYLPEILEKIKEQINSRDIEEGVQINVDDPEDLSFWATQFELSEADLKKAILAVGTDVDAVTSYLQK